MRGFALLPGGRRRDELTARVFMAAGAAALLADVVWRPGRERALSLAAWIGAPQSPVISLVSSALVVAAFELCRRFTHQPNEEHNR